MRDIINVLGNVTVIGGIVILSRRLSPSWQVGVGVALVIVGVVVSLSIR